MTKTKLLLSISIISLIYTGCGEQEVPNETKKEDVKVEVKVQESVTNEQTKIEKVIEKKAETITPMIKKVQEIVTIPDVKTTFQKCSACHGKNAEKKALNKSAIIKDWNASKIEEALIGYKNGTYGGAMKGLMQSQVNSLSDKEITDLSKYISTLNK